MKEPPLYATAPGSPLLVRVKVCGVPRFAFYFEAFDRMCVLLGKARAAYVSAAAIAEWHRRWHEQTGNALNKDMAEIIEAELADFRAGRKYRCLALSR